MELLASLLSSLRATDGATIEQEYSAVRSRSLSMKKELGLISEVGALKENIKKNRYKDILPYDRTRVVLSLDSSASDYINASFIQGASAGCRYIACQAPLSSTLTDFWGMIWQHNVRVIVMACREVEMGKRKCERYWAAAQQTASFGPFTITCQEETHPNDDVVVRTLNVSHLQDTRSLTQYQFLSWPDHDVPYETGGVLDLLQRVRSSRGADTSSPLLIHCSAGCGRTGVICALDYIHDLLVTKQVTEDFSILKVVLELRQQRPSAVQTKEQYQFIFTAVCCMLESLLQSREQQLYCNLPQQLKPERRGTTKAASSINRLSLQVNMNDTYAVVNKQPRPPPSGHAQPALAPPTSSRGSGTPSTSHHYDNEPGAAAAPVYSAVRPRGKPHGRPHSALPLYDTAAPSDRSPAEGAEYQLVSAQHPAAADSDYEDVSSAAAGGSRSPAGIGFQCRVQRPKGPRNPPAEWSRLDR